MMGRGRERQKTFYGRKRGKGKSKKGAIHKQHKKIKGKDSEK
jgi:hypothetical protein